MDKSYAVQDGCHNCIHLFELHDYDQGNEHYCTFDAPPRPMCCSVAMDEWPDEKSEEVSHKALIDWGEWSEDRRVKEQGICKNHVKGVM